MRSKRTPKIVVPIALALTLALAAGSYAYFTNSGSVSGRPVSAGHLNPPTEVTVPATATGSVSVSWTASSTAGGAVTPQGYYVTRTNVNTEATANACGTTPPPLPELETGTSCTDTSVPEGTYTYTVTAVYNSWTATSAASGEVSVRTAVPAFTIEKKQKLETQAATSYTTTELTDPAGAEKVDYRVIVKNTGNTSLEFNALSDAGCTTAISPSGIVTLTAGSEQTYTCERTLTDTPGTYTNIAHIKDSEATEHSSNEVKVEVPAVPAFTIEKKQKLETQAATSYTTTELTDPAGAEKVDYRVIVKNTGNTSLEFNALSDAGCTTAISPSGIVTLTAGSEQTYTCERTLTDTPGTYTNIAHIKDSEATEHSSNEVKVEVPAVPAFTIEKKQKLETQAATSYTTTELTDPAGAEKVDYRVIVKNTGNTSLEFNALSDAGCTTAISPSGIVTLTAGSEQTYTCERTLTDTPGTYTNIAHIKDSEATEHSSNEVKVEVPAVPAFTIEKKQKLETQAATSYTTTELTDPAGAEKVDYRVIVKNTGNTSLEFNALSDAGCTTAISPSGIVTLTAGSEQTYTCERTLTDTPGTYTNIAHIKDSEATEHSSNEVKVEVPAVPAFTIEKKQKLETQAATSYTTTELTDPAGAEKVDYRVIVKNTGNTSLEFNALSDAGCTTAISPSGIVTLTAGSEQTYTCERTLTDTPGTYTNIAHIKDSEATEHSSNEVKVEVPAVPAFTIEKKQKLETQAATSYTTTELTDPAGAEKVDYRVIVKNTGNTSLEFNALSDAGCTTAISPSGIVTLTAGSEQTYTCERTLTDTPGTYTNIAHIKDSEATEHSSNEVKVEVPAVPAGLSLTDITGSITCGLPSAGVTKCTGSVSSSGSFSAKVDFVTSGGVPAVFSESANSSVTVDVTHGSGSTTLTIEKGMTTSSTAFTESASGASGTMAKITTASYTIEITVTS